MVMSLNKNANKAIKYVTATKSVASTPACLHVVSAPVYGGVTFLRVSVQIFTENKVPCKNFIHELN
jgi:hypothetical protein|tara:strand:+ start:824 stop:1021 length:198 start_codon:yes stop_codon:yes gene_type:complete